NQFRMGLIRMERIIKERMTISDPHTVTSASLINARPVVAAIKEFFGSSQLSQFMDQHNPLSELTHKRRLSALGPGGLSRERAGEVLDAKAVQKLAKSRIAAVDIVPWVSTEVEYLSADEEDMFGIAQANAALTPDNNFTDARVPARTRSHYGLEDVGNIQYMDVSPKQIVSVATAMIPFLEHDDADI